MKVGQTSYSGARRRGFTLVEVLVALGILAMVLTAIYSTWTAILRSSKVGMEAAASAQRARIAIRTIEDSLWCAQSYEAGLTNYEFIADNGSEATLSFVARVPSSFPRYGRWPGINVRRIKFSLESGPDYSSQLVLRQKPLLQDLSTEFDEDEMNHPLVLAKYVKEFKIEFTDPRSGEWIDEWKQVDQLPKCVRITLRLTDNAKARTHREEQEIIGIVTIPSTRVLRVWQMPMGLPGQPPPGAVPPGGNPPGTVPPGAVPPGTPPGAMPQPNLGVPRR
jgi:prepilin-type N-terminal cleavage/methylation domain-containing protein